MTGIHIKSSANILRNVHPLYYTDGSDYENSCGFGDEGGRNWYDFCYSDQFGGGFRTAAGIRSFYNNCFCYWYSDAGANQTVFRADGKFDSVVTTFSAGLRNKDDNRMLIEKTPGGSGVFERVYIDYENRLAASDAYLKHLRK